MDKPKNKKFYFSKEDLNTLSAKDGVIEYVQGVIHQDKLFYIMAVVLPRLGLPQGTAFSPLDSDGNSALETGKMWVAIEVAEIARQANGKPEPNEKPKKGKVR
jgi:hypothetical protein